MKSQKQVEELLVQFENERKFWFDSGSKEMEVLWTLNDRIEMLLWVLED